MDRIANIIVILLNSFCFRVRGGFGEKWGWRLPLCKWWFCTCWTLCCIYYMPSVDWHSWIFWQKIICIFIGARLSTNICGWGEAVGCALGLRKPDPAELHCLPFDKFCDNLAWPEIKIFKWTIPAGKLIDHPQLYGVIWLTCRGALLTYLMASPMNNIPLILWGSTMGVIYWFAGWLCRHGVNDGKGGWRIAEWLDGGWLGLGICLFG